MSRLGDILGSLLGGAIGKAASGAASAPLMGIPGAVEAGAKLGKTVVDGGREAKRDAKDAAITKEEEENAKLIRERVNAPLPPAAG